MREHYTSQLLAHRRAAETCVDAYAHLGAVVLLDRALRAEVEDPEPCQLVGDWPAEDFVATAGWRQLYTVPLDDIIDLVRDRLP